MKRQEQKGFVLFVVMIFLIVMSLLGITMYGGFIKDQKMSGNMREKQRAIQAAQVNLDMVEKWMQGGNTFEGGWATGIVCDSTSQAGALPVVCSNALANPASLPWPSSQTYQPTGTSMTVVAGGGANSYSSVPAYYVQYLGANTTKSALYKVTSTAQGGNATAAAVLETIYEVSCTICPGEPPN